MPSQISGIITLPSPYKVVETLDRLEQILQQKNVKVFARVDHSGEAQRAGLQMPPTQLLIFGNPRGGTPVMLAAQLSAIDLPLKALAWQDTEGKVWLSYNDPEHLKDRYGLTEDIVAPLHAATALLQQAIG